MLGSDWLAVGTSDPGQTVNLRGIAAVTTCTRSFACTHDTVLTEQRMFRAREWTLTAVGVYVALDTLTLDS